MCPFAVLSKNSISSELKRVVIECHEFVTLVHRTSMRMSRIHDTRPLSVKQADISLHFGNHMQSPFKKLFMLPGCKKYHF